MSLLSRLFVWSVVFEPLLLFMLADRSSAGISLNVSRILQSLVVAGLVVRAAVRLGAPARGRVVEKARVLYRTYAVYFWLSVLTGVLGLAWGAYDTPVSYGQSTGVSAYSRWLNSALLRPLFEYVIAAFYFLYFVMLPRHLLTTPRHVSYMFKVFRGMFVLSFMVGMADLVLSSFGVNLVPRHFSDMRMIGGRFHGMAGEPRHAFVYLFLGWAMLHLEAWYRGRRLGRAWPIAIVSAAALTQSLSGLLGIVCFAGLYALWVLSRVSVRQILRFVVVMVPTVAVLYFAVTRSERVLSYGARASAVWYALETDAKLDPTMTSQRDNLYPLHELILKARALDVLPIVIGSGLGSASVVTNRRAYWVDSELSNPNAQVVRSLYETGLLGTGLFILAFTRPMRYLTKSLPRRRRQEFFVFTLLLLGVCFFIRSSAIFIYLGACIAVFRVVAQKGAGAETQ